MYVSIGPGTTEASYSYDTAVKVGFGREPAVGRYCDKQWFDPSTDFDVQQT